MDFDQLFERFINVEPTQHVNCCSFENVSGYAIGKFSITTETLLLLFDVRFDEIVTKLPLRFMNEIYKLIEYFECMVTVTSEVLFKLPI